LPATVETVSYGGWPHNLRLANAEVEAIVTLDVGPRIIRYAPHGGDNLLKEVPEELGGTGEDRWVMRGGHRLWTSPEDPLRSYVPDNGPASHTVQINGGPSVTATTPADPVTHLERTLRLRLEDSGTGLTVQHVVTNRGKTPVTIAAWALTVMRPGGTAIIPWPPFRPHPEDHAESAEDYAPGITMALWPYCRLSDARFEFGDSFLRIKQDSQATGPTKIGLGLAAGWAGYLHGDTLFLKRFPWRSSAPYPDGGCNFESYTDNALLELESLGPLTVLPPGQQLEHTEVWALATGLAGLTDDQALEERVRLAFRSPA
jgi:hypothetical protein